MRRLARKPIPPLLAAALAAYIRTTKLFWDEQSERQGVPGLVGPSNARQCWSGLVVVPVPSFAIKPNRSNASGNALEHYREGNMLGSRQRLLSLCSTAMLMALGTAAMAQEQPQAEDQNQDKEIIVTATRIETTLQKTPVAVNVYSGNDLREQNITTIQSLQSIDPSLNITQSGNTPQIAIRGIQGTNNTEVGIPSVGVARDGFFTNRVLSLALSFYDLGRIEVLKGPQGTLFGRASTGGLVHILTARPKLGETSGFVNTTVGNYGMFGGEAAVNVPLGDKIAVRLSLYGRDRDGFRTINGPNYKVTSDDDRSLSGRAQILVNPTDNFEVLVRYQRDHAGGIGPVLLSGNFGESFSNNPFAFDGTIRPSQKLENTRVTWETNLRDLPGDGTLTYTGGTEGFAADIITDATSPRDIVTGSRSERIRTVNHELRYAANPIDGLTVQVGGFYFRESNTPLIASFRTNNRATGAASSFIQFNYAIRQTSEAIFGQATYSLTPEVRFTAGARQTWDSVLRTGVNDLTVFNLPGPFLGTCTPSGGVFTCRVLTPASTVPKESSKFTYKFGLDWDVGPQNLVYAKYDTGYRPGGFSTDPNNPNNSFGPETVTSYELGTKNRLLNNSLTLNANVFYQVLDGFQAAVLGGATVNAGKTKTYGFEFATNFRASDSTRIDFNGTYLHGRFGTVVPFLNGPFGVVNVSGKRLPNAPTWVFNAALEQDFAFSEGTITARIDGKYSSATIFENVGNPDTTQPAYGMGNASLNYRSDDGVWRAQVFVRNFTNEVVYSRANRTQLPNTNPPVRLNQYQFQPPRTFGAQFGYSF